MVEYFLRVYKVVGSNWASGRRPRSSASVRRPNANILYLIKIYIMEHLTTFFKSGLIFSFFKKKNLNLFFLPGFTEPLVRDYENLFRDPGPDGSGYPPNGSGLILN